MPSEGAIREDLLRSVAYPAHTLGNDPIHCVETHVSLVFLTGQHAYKIKKAVQFPFLDFSTLEKRKAAIAAEYTINCALSPELYLGTVAVYWDAAHGYHMEQPLSPSAQIADYAIQMRQFAQADLFSERVKRGAITPKDWEVIARTVYDMHRGANSLAPWEFGTFAAVQQHARDNFIIRQLPVYQAWQTSETEVWLQAVESYVEQLDRSQSERFNKRHAGGHIRACHGDLHLQNMVQFQGKPCIFDAIEFNPEFRYTDTMSDVAFLTMDLASRGYAQAATLFLNAYLAVSHDFSGLSVLRYYQAYRAMVRAKIAVLSAASEADVDERAACLRYLQQAASYVRPSVPCLYIMHGVSGSGKSTLAKRLSPDLGAVLIRADTVRKQLFHVMPTDHSHAARLYTPKANLATQQALLRAAQTTLLAGFSVILDATHLAQDARNLAKACAETAGAVYKIISCTAEDEAIRERLLDPVRVATDPSDASWEVVAQQILHQDPLTAQELTQTRVVHTDATLHYPDILAWCHAAA